MTAFVNKLCVPFLFGLLIAGYPIASGISVLSGIPNQSLAILFRAIVLMLSCYVILRAIIFRNTTEEERISTIVYWCCLCMMWGSYSARFFIDVLQGDRYSEVLVMVGTFVGSTLVPFFALRTQEAIPRSHLVFKVAFYSVLIAALFNIHLLWSSNIINQLATMAGRAGFESLNPISLAMLGAQLTILSLFVLVTRDKGVPVIGFHIVVPALLIGGVVMLIGGSRGPILAFACSLVPLYFLSAVSLQGTARARMTLIACAVVVVLVYVAVILQDVYNVSTVVRVEALVTGGLAEDYTSYLRLIAMGGAIDQFLGSPLIGDSIVVEATGGYPHNIPLEFLMATGLLGFSGYVVLLVWSLRNSVHIIFHYRACGWIVLLYSQVLTIGMISGNVWSSSLLWGLMGSTICLGEHHKLRTQTKRYPSEKMRYASEKH